MKRHLILDKKICDTTTNYLYLGYKQYASLQNEGNKIPSVEIEDKFRYTTLSYWGIRRNIFNAPQRFTFLKKDLKKSIKINNNN